MEYREETRKTYDQFPKAFDKKFEESFWRFGKQHADLFLQHLSGKKVADLGSGPGQYARYFTEKGLEVLCVDISEEMVKLCKEKGLEAVQMDLEYLKLPERSFDGVWMYASLLHIPKAHVPHALEGVWKILKPGGVLGLAVKEGGGEGFEEREDYPGAKRWFTYFTDEEVRELFEKDFTLLEFFRDNVFLHYMFQLQEGSLTKEPSGALL